MRPRIGDFYNAPSGGTAEGRAFDLSDESAVDATFTVMVRRLGKMMSWSSARTQRCIYKPR